MNGRSGSDRAGLETPPEVSVLVVNWNAGDLLARCVASVPVGLGRLTGEVIVVDNASTDRSLECLPEVEWLRLVRRSENKGFACGTNEAANMARGRVLVALNPDAECTEGSLESLVAHLDRQPGTGAVGPRIVFGDGRAQRSAWHGFPGLWPAAIDACYLWKAPRLPGVGRSEISTEGNGEALDVDHLLGACMAVPRRVWQDVGPFDEDYFLFLEETDWCRRARAAGYRIRWLPEATVIHHGERSVYQAPAVAMPQYYRSYARFVRRTGAGRTHMAALKAVFVLAMIVRLVLWSVRVTGRRRELARRMVAGYARALAGVGSY